MKVIDRYMYYKNISTTMYDVLTADSFVIQTQDETEVQAECKDAMCMMVSLEMEMSTAGIFLMNGMDIRQA